MVGAESYDVANAAIECGKEKGVAVTASRIAHDSSVLPKDLFLSFVEVYLMGDARCVAYGRGGHGQLGFMLGYDYDCRIKYSVSGPHYVANECEWIPAGGAQVEFSTGDLAETPIKAPENAADAAWEEAAK